MKIAGIDFMMVLVAWCALLFPDADAAVYRVGPEEQHTTLSQVAHSLQAGDVVEVTGNVSDNVTLTTFGTADKPITIRGVTRVEGGRIVRPQITPASALVPFIIKCEGTWIVLEGIALSGFLQPEWGKAALIHAGANLVLRNCRIHHNIRAVYADPERAGDILVAFCEFESNGYAQKGPTSLFSINPSATATVEHCYFHDNTGSTLLRACFARNVIRYNWFENPYKFALQITTPSFSKDEAGRNAADVFLPAHSDIVGNVFAFGWAVTPKALLQLGGAGADNPGTEGDFSIAHNLFLTRRGGAIPQVAVLVHGNVDRIRMYSNVFLECRTPGGKLYEYERSWQGPLTTAFKERRGSGTPRIEGSNNWISVTASDVPGELEETISAAIQVSWTSSIMTFVP